MIVVDFNLEDRWAGHPMRAVPKLLGMCLLMSLRDGASELHFSEDDKSCKLSYIVAGAPHELVPPPHRYVRWLVRFVESLECPSKSRRILARTFRRLACAIDGRDVENHFIRFNLKVADVTATAWAGLRSVDPDHEVCFQLHEPGIASSVAGRIMGEIFGEEDAPGGPFGEDDADFLSRPPW